MHWPVEESIRIYPELADLQLLDRAGWRFVVERPGDEAPTGLNGFRAWPGGVTDGLLITSSTDVLGIRTLPGEPPTIAWERTGTLRQVVAELLVLPEPSAATAPRLVVASAPRLWTPGR